MPVYRQVPEENNKLPPVVVNLNEDFHSFTPAPLADASVALPRQAEEVDPIERVKFALRGRWPLTIALALLFGATGAYFGWMFKPVTYKSEGMIEIPYLRPRVLHPSDADQPMSLFDSQLTAQAERIKSRSIVDAALATPEWQRTGRGNTAKVATEFAFHLSAEHPPTTDLIKIAFVDRDPATAASAVNAVINVFAATFKTEAEGLEQEKMQALEVRRQQLSGRLQSLESAMEAELPAAPATGPTPLTSAVAPVLGSPTTAPVLSPGPELFRLIAQTDPIMREYLAQREMKRDTLASLKDIYGENHPEVIRQSKDLDRLTDKIYRYAAQWHPPVGETMASVAGGTGGTRVSTQPTLEQVQMSPHYQALKADAGNVHTELNNVIRRIEDLRMENSVGGRLTVVAHGEPPAVPFSDSRLKYAVAGGGVAAALPVGLLVLLGLLGQTYRFSTDAEETSTESVPMLGILPILSDRRDELEKRADAAHCVHQIRAILQMRRPMQSAYMITSAAAGEGKTSLAGALAFAFAASGARTLLIDADLVGQRLTGGFHCDRHLGLHDAIAGANLSDCIKRIEHGMRFMPVGKTGTTLAAWTLSALSIRKILAEARHHFDAVIVDTGPVLGSVEASVVAPEVDGVIFTIARGQQRWLVEKATRHLQSMGGKLIGFVFNRAQARDFNRSAFRSSARSSTTPQEPDWSPRRPVPENMRLGPLVHSVATLLPQDQDPEVSDQNHNGNGNGHR